MFTITEEHLFSSREIDIEPSDLIVYDDEDKTASSALIRQALNKGISIVAAGEYASFPVHIPHGVLYMRFTNDMLEEVIRPPWIKGLTPSAIESLDRVLRTRMRSPNLIGQGIMMGDPTDRQCYYEICRRAPRQHGKKNAELYPEALLSAILTQYATFEGVRTMYLFLETPYKPKSNECYRALLRAEKEGLEIVRLSKEKAGNEKPNREPDRYKILVDDKKRLYTIKNNKKLKINIA